MAKSFWRFHKGFLLVGESSDLTDNVEGLMWHNSTSNKIKTYLNSAVQTVATDSNTLTFTNKTLTSPNINEAVALTATSTELNQLDGVSIGGNTSGDVLTTDDTQNITGKTINSDNNTITNIVNADIKAAAAIALNKLAAVTASRALASDGSGFITASTATSTELGYLSGVTSAIQTQLNSKLSASGFTALRVLETDGSGNIQVSGVTQAELAQLSGVTFGGTSPGDVATIDGNQALTQKSLDADVNTITNIDNNEIKAAAGIDRSKLASGTANHVVINSGTGAFSSEAQLAVSRGGLGADFSTGEGILQFSAGIPSDKLLSIDDSGASTRTTFAVTSDTTGKTLTLPNATDTLVGRATTDVLINKSIDSDNNTITNIVNADIKAAAAIALNKLAATTASRALQSDGSGFIEASSVTSTELGHVSGVTGAIQTQLDSKVDEVSSTDNAVVKFDGTGGSVQDTGVIIDDSNNVSGANEIKADAQLTLQEITTPSNPAAGYKSIYPKADGKLYSLDDAGIELEIGSGGGAGGINYIDNNDFETDVTGWTTYADAAGTSPVDGTGGSPNVTFTRTTSNPLRGDGSGLLTVDAANRQGEGVSYDFTLDRQDLGKPIYVSFDYETSANYVSDDIIPFIYDKDGTALTTLTKSGTSSRFTGVFYSDSTNDDYRLILHVASTNSSGYTFKIDNVSVGPTSIIDGVIETYLGELPTTGSWTTNTTYVGKYWRSGEFLIGSVRVNPSGPPNSAYFSLNLPYSANISRMANTHQPVGTVRLGENGVAGFPGTLMLVDANTIVIEFFHERDESTNITRTGTVYYVSPFTWDVGDFIQIEYKVPISDWANQTAMLSTTEMLNESEGSSVYGQVTNSFSTTSWAYNNLVYPTVSKDDQDLYSSGVITVGKSGWKTISASLEYTLSTAPAVGDIMVLGLKKNSDQDYRAIDSKNGNGSETDWILHGSYTDYFEKGDTLQVYFRKSGTATTTATGDDRTNYFTIASHPDSTVYGVYGNYELLTNNSNSFSLGTAGYATGEWAQMTNNSLTLTPGTWTLCGQGNVQVYGVASVQRVLFKWATANGNNTSSEPPSPTVDFGHVYTSQENSPEFGSPINMNLSTVNITVTSNTTIYAVPLINFTAAGSSVIRIKIAAERKR